jgi:hypothetical protein
LLGPVTGSVSQNCVWRNWPPGLLTQHELTEVALAAEEQLWAVLEHVASAESAAALASGRAARTATTWMTKEAMVVT